MAATYVKCGIYDAVPADDDFHLLVPAADVLLLEDFSCQEFTIEDVDTLSIIRW